MERFSVTVYFSKSLCDINTGIQIDISNDQTLQSISKTICARAKIPYVDKYQFLNAYKTPLSMANTVQCNDIRKDAYLVLIDPTKDNCLLNNPDRIIYQYNIWKSLAIIALFISLVGLIILITIYVISLSSMVKYSVVIDAGSTSSKIYLYSWVSNTYLYNADVKQLVTCKTALGISSYETNPNQSFAGILQCLENTIITQIPNEYRDKTFVFLGATAGMRMLSLTNPNATEKIMNFLRESFSKYHLKVNDSMSDISIISGSKEGLYGWITVNYLSKSLPKSIVENPKLFGALDMGGASTQITFIDPSPKNSNNTYQMNLYGNSYSVYSHSYLCYGKSQAECRFFSILVQNSNFNTTVLNPCMSKGQSAVYNSIDIFTAPCVTGKFALDHYGHEILPPKNWLTNGVNVTFLGTSDFTGCQSVVLQLFNDTKCERKPCTFNGVYQPMVVGDFKAFSAYKFIKTKLNEGNLKWGLKDYKESLMKLCLGNSTEKNFFDTNNDAWVKLECFDMSYMIEILVQLGFNEGNWLNIDFIDMIDNFNIGWALGFMIDKTSIIAKGKHFLPIENYLFIILLLVLIVVLVFALIFVYFYIQYKNQNKTHKKNNCLIEEQNLLSSTITQ